MFYSMVSYHDYHDSCSYHITHMPVCPTWTNRGVNNSINFFPPEQIAATDCSGRCALVLGWIYQILFSKYIKCTNYQNIRTNIFKYIFLLGGWWIAMFWVIGRANQTDSDALLQSPDGQHSTTSHIFCFCGNFQTWKPLRLDLNHFSFAKIIINSLSLQISQILTWD